MSVKVFYSHGKLLLTGEYLVLDGAKALAVPTNKGQYLSVKTTHTDVLHWRSYDDKNNVWFEYRFELSKLNSCKTSNTIAATLVEILLAAQALNPEFLIANEGFDVTTRLTFSREFGLGTSSTLIANIAKWAQVDPYKLLWNSFKGSGYDIACAITNGALVYEIENSIANVTPVSFNPSYKDHLYFVYLNKKQDSKEGISHYRELPDANKEYSVKQVNAITEKLIDCRLLSEFEKLVREHEMLLSDLLQLPTVKEQLFTDYVGEVKSLGAWGGDFVMVTIKSLPDLNYFKYKGYDTILSFDDMLLQ
ncbi:MAG: GYDIA family GHMP kinase [Flavobacteriaceae bacterium]